MKTIRTLLAGLFVAVLSIGGGNAVRGEDKQTEPVKTAPAPKAGKKYTPEELVEVFENLGFPTKTYNGKDGAMAEIGLEIQQSGWTFRTSIMWNKDQSRYYLVATIVSTDGKAPIPAEVLKEMLIQNGNVYPSVLVYSEQPDGSVRVSLFLEFANDGLTPAVLRQKVSGFCDQIKLAVQARDKADAVAKAKAQAKAEPKEPVLP